MTRIRLLLSLVALCALQLAPPAAAQVPPDASWRTFDTEHFRVTYVEGLETVARRAAERAEQAHQLLARELLEPPADRIELVVADNVDFTNGYASPLPRNRIVLYAHPPVSAASLTYYDDWLGLILLHELVHIYHLDQAGGIWTRLRGVFGRSPVLFPQVFTPGWITEGLATYYESALTGAGRVRGTHHDMVLRTAALEDRFFAIDRATGSPTTWPGGASDYVYGSLFLDHLARRYGREQVRRFLESYGRQLVPYRVDAGARRAFGVSFSRAWREWRDSLQTRYAAQADTLRAIGLTEPEVLTREGRSAAFPRFGPDGRLVYAAGTGLDEPALRLIEPDGTVREVEELTVVGPATWLGGGELLFAQLNYTDPYRVYSDLYRVRLSGGDRRLTRAARIWEPHAHPDGRGVVAVGNAGGSNTLVLHDLATGSTRPLVAPDPDVHWALPRWSPAGDRIAAVRWSRGGFYDVVLLDSTGAVVRELTRDRAVDDAPAWSPDGRWVVFSSDRTGIPNLFAYDLQDGSLRQVTNVLTGAFQPDVSPDGRWVAFSYYLADGYHIARVPWDPSAWRSAPPVRAEASVPAPDIDFDAVAGGADRPYSALPSALPTSWALLLDQAEGLGVGAGVSLFGRDVIERHLWNGYAALYPDARRLDAGAGYRFRGLGNPVLDMAAVQNWSTERSAGTVVTAQGDTIGTALLRRERELRASLSWLRPRWRSLTWLTTGAELQTLHREWDEPELASGLRLRTLPLDAGVTLSAGYSSVRAYGVSISPQEGFSASGTAEAHRYLEPVGDDADPAGYLRLVGRGRGFQALALPGFARHVLALRADVGSDQGSRSPGFRVGGASGGASPLPVQLDILGAGLSFPVRGYPEGAQTGNRALVAGAEYRFPLALVDRGFRTLPLFLGRVWGDLFADVGTAWCSGEGERCATRDPSQPAATFDPLTSVGAELVADLQVGFFASLPLRFGVAFPLHAEYARRPEWYVRIGRSF